jgi:hypothetical protein
MKHSSFLQRIRRIHYPAKSRKNRVQHTALSDATPLWIEMLIVLVFSPVLISAAIYAGLKWFFTVPFKLRYPKTNEAKRMILTEKYLYEIDKSHYRKGVKKAKAPEKVYQN